MGDLVGGIPGAILGGIVGAVASSIVGHMADGTWDSFQNKYDIHSYNFPDRLKEILKDYFPSMDADGVKTEDPIILDLNGDGVKTTNIENGTYFDYENDGFAEKTGWVDKNDGILSVDINRDGKISGGSEILTGNTIAQYDTNHDGIIDSNDANFSDLRILKGDGTLQSLADAQIASINLGTTNTDITDANGNNQFAQGTFTKTDGTTASYGDFNLKTDPASSVETSTVPVSDEIKALPDINGSGTVHSLQQAAEMFLKCA